MEAAGPRPRTGLATLSLVLGILANLCLWFVAAVPAILGGHIALSRSRRRPDRYGGRQRAIAGLTLGYVGLLFGAIAPALLVAKGVRVLTSKRSHALQAQCAHRFEALVAAVRAYASEHEGNCPPDIAALTNHLADVNLLRCPADTSRVIGAPTDPQNVSYELLLPSTNLTAVARQPILRCRKHGAVAFADGSVQLRNQ